MREYIYYDKLQNIMGCKKLKKNILLSAKKSEFFKRFEFKIVLIIAMTAFFTALSAFIVIAVQRHNASINVMKIQSEIIAGYTLNVIDKNIFHEINVHGDESKDLYVKVSRQLEEIKHVSGLRYLYTIKKDQAGTIVYHIDGQSAETPDFCHIGTPIEEGILEEAKLAMAGQRAVAKKVINTSYGPVLASYWYVKNAQNEVIGALGIEYDAKNLTNLDKRALLTSLAIIICIVIFMSLLFILVYKNISVLFHQKLAYVDFLTGLNNRMAFELDLKSIHQNNSDAKVVMVVFDLNNLKQVNDTYGHSSGDVYLKESAALILESFTDAGELYRIGGDEFVLLCLAHEEEHIKARLDTVFVNKMKVFRDELEKKFPGIFFNIAYGSGSFKEGVHSDLHDVFKDADMEMYKTKKSMKLYNA